MMKLSLTSALVLTMLGRNSRRGRRPPPWRPRRSRTHVSIAGIRRSTPSSPRTGRSRNWREGFGWAEGPLWIKSGGYLLFTDVPGNKMYKWSAKGGLEKFLDPSGAASHDPNVWREAGANGLTLFDAHSILLADTGNRGIQKLDLATKKKTPVAMTFEGKKFSSPNDVISMKNGVVFFTDPPYGFKKFDAAPEKEIAFNGVYRVGKDGKVTAIEKELTRPNGVALSPDESILYVAQSEGTKAIINAYSLDKDGNVTGKKLFLDVTDLVSADAPGAARRSHGRRRRHGIHQRPRRHPGDLEGRQASGPHLGRQADRQLQVRRRRQDVVPDLERLLARIRLNIKGAGF